MSDKITQFVQELLVGKPVEKRGKTNYSLSLDVNNMAALKAFCEKHKGKDYTASRIMDRLLGDFVEELKKQDNVPLKRIGKKEI